MKFRFVIPLLMFTFTCFSQGKIGRPSLPILDNSNNQPRSFIFLPKKSSLYSSSNFMFNDKKYPSFKVFNEKIIQKSFDAQIGLLSNGGAYLRLEAEKNYINGTVLIHLSTGKVIRCTDKFLREKISNNYISYYYLTKAELIAIMDKDFKLKKIEYSNNGESRVVNASGYYENDLFLKSRESNLLRLELGLTTTENTDKKPSSSNSKISSYNTKTEKNLVTTALDAPRREDYSSYEAWLASHEKWFQEKYPSGTFSSNNRSTSNSNNRFTSRTKTNKKNDYSETGFILGIGYIEGIAINIEGYFGSWSLGFRSTFYNNDLVVNLQGVIGVKLIKSIYLKAAIGNANNASPYAYSLNYPFIDYTSYSAGLSFFRNYKKISLSPEVFYDFQKKSVGGILSISF